MKRGFRLTSSTDFKRVRRLGKSYAHPLVVLIRHPNILKKSRFGVGAGKSVGGAIHRNRAKRQIREIIRPLIPAIPPGWDVIILARRPIVKAQYSEIEKAIKALLKRAALLTQSHDN